MKQEKLTKARKMKGLSQQELASLINMEQTTYSRKERGIHSFTEKEWKQIASELKTTIEDLRESEQISQYNENCTFNENSIGCVGVNYANVPKEMFEMMKKYIALLEQDNGNLRNQLTDKD